MRPSLSSSLLQRFQTTPALRALLYFALLLLLFALYGCTHFYRDPGSIFFSKTRGYERQYSLRREAEANDFLKSVESNPTSNTKSSSDPLICASFITVGRDGLHIPYIYQAISSVLANMTTEERNALHLAILFADASPEENKDRNSTILKKLVDDTYTTADIASPEIQSHLQQLAWQHETNEKGTLDYTLALQYCLEKTSSPWLAVFEDDILVAKGWLARTIHGLREVESVVHNRNTPETPQKPQGETRGWLLLRLFNQERSTGWVSRRIGGNHEFMLSVIVGAIVLPILFITKKKGPHSLKTHLDNPTIGLICLLFIPTIIVLFFQTGKANLFPPQPGVHEEDFGCCSQALVFNRAEAPGLIQYLRAQGRGRCDLMTTMYARETGIRRWSQYPMMVQHVGSHSATGTTEDEARAVWSMAFEDLNAAHVDTDHRAFVDSEFGTA